MALDRLSKGGAIFSFPLPGLSVIILPGLCGRLTRRGWPAAGGWCNGTSLKLMCRPPAAIADHRQWVLYVAAATPFAPDHSRANSFGTTRASRYPLESPSSLMVSCISPTKMAN